MNREIKFRAWSSYFKKMYLNIQLLDSLNEYINRGEHEIMQYTGLKDKNGKEIYEGDILRFKANYTKKPCGYVVCKVEFSSYGIELTNALYSYDPIEETSEFPYTSEVIGNIYENPELLE